MTNKDANNYTQDVEQVKAEFYEKSTTWAKTATICIMIVMANI